MIDDFAKQYLLEDLRWVRQSVVGKLEGLSEYDVRRPLTGTGTNLLGLVKHLTLSEAVYLGICSIGPSRRRIPDSTTLTTGTRTGCGSRKANRKVEIVEGYWRACQHSDATIQALPIDATGHVPWWPQLEVKLFNVMVHILTETNRHAGHADILSEQLNDAASAADPTKLDSWTAHRARIEEAARRSGGLVVE